MVRNQESKGRLYSYLACINLIASALLLPQSGIAAEPINVELISQVSITSAAAQEYRGILETSKPWSVALGEGSVVAGVSQLFNLAEERSRQFVADQDRKIRSELSGWYATQSSIVSKQSNTLLSNRDSGLSVGIGIDEFSVDWKVKF